MADPGDPIAPDVAAPGLDVTEVDDRIDDKVPWRIFLAVGLAIGVLAAIYLATSYEESGSVMLGVAAVLGLWCGTFFWLNLRKLRAGDAGVPGGSEALYLPDASPWPFGIGVGATLLLLAIVVGVWILVPGAMVLGVSIAGFARQSRHRL